MTRSQKIQKLANAVKDYRGSYDEKTGVWMRHPKTTAVHRVMNWLERLNIPVEPAMEIIRNFKHKREFDAWIRTL